MPTAYTLPLANVGVPRGPSPYPTRLASPNGVDHFSCPVASSRAKTCCRLLFCPLPKISPPATLTELYPPPSPVAVHTFGGPASGHFLSRPFSSENPLRCGP